MFSVKLLLSGINSNGDHSRWERNPKSQAAKLKQGPKTKKTKSQTKRFSAEHDA
jgi:hypothetical protein